MRWLIKCLGVKPADLRCRVGINAIHTKREQVVREYWSKDMGVVKPTPLYYRIMGLIEGLACQGSSVVEHRIHIPAVASSILAPGTK